MSDAQLQNRGVSALDEIFSLTESPRRERIELEWALIIAVHEQWVLDRFSSAGNA